MGDAEGLLIRRYGTADIVELSVKVAEDMRLDVGQRDKALAFLSSKMAIDGMEQGVADRERRAKEARAAFIEANTNKQSGQLVTATLKADDRRVYVIEGEVVTNGDGSVNVEGTTESLIVRDAETGAIEMIDPHAIMSVEAVDNSQFTGGGTVGGWISCIRVE